MSSEDKNLFNVTCLDCKTSKSYFTAQGVNFFKANHEGHHFEVKEPGATQGPQKSTSGPQAVMPRPVQAPKAVQVSMDDIVVDIVDEENGRSIKVYGISGGQEKFTKTFGITSIEELNAFLESGKFDDAGSKATYLWAPDRVDLSKEVAVAMHESPSAPRAQAVEAQMTRQLQVAPPPQPTFYPPSAPTVPQPAPEERALPARVSAAVVAGEPLATEAPFLQDSERYKLESLRILNALREFNRGDRTQYTIGALFDELLSIQSQTGAMTAGAIEAVIRLGYGFVDAEVQAGRLNTWIKRKALPAQ
jgi:hypothetical protein